MTVHNSDYEVEMSSETDPDGTDSQNEEYAMDPSTETTQYSYNPYVEIDPADDMPDKYKTIRSGMRGVREEIYVLSSTLSSTYHMSARQIEGSICEVANILFGRNFKPH
ncbi:unnamed protein product, partial [Meganyctiphanes norvegica]